MTSTTAPVRRRHAVIVGAGIAGLATALRLAVGGMRVTVLERHDHAGGKIRTLPSDAGPIDAGPTVLTLRHVFDDLFACAGARLDDHVSLVAQDVLARHHWPDGSRLDLFADPDASADAIRSFAGARAADEFRAFGTRAARLYSAFDNPIMQAPAPRLSQLVPHVLARPSLIPAMAPLSSLAAMLRRQFTDPRLAQLFGRYATYVGGAPHLSPAILSLIWQAEAAGVWVVEGGMHKLTDAIAALATAHGVAFQHGAHVNHIELRGGRVAAVQLAVGTRIPADEVVFAGDPRALATGALGSGLRHVAPRTATLPRSFSARVHSFAATPSGADLIHHNVFFAADPHSEFNDLAAGRIPADPTLYLCALDRGQGHAPKPLERFEIISNAPAPSDTQTPPELDQWHHQIMTRLTRFGLTLSPTPRPQDITTPQMFAQMFPATRGALYGQTPHGMTATFKRPTAATPVPGLWLAGGGVHPGPGVPMATLSARHAAEAILSAQTSTSTSHRTAMRGGMSTA